MFVRLLNRVPAVREALSLKINNSVEEKGSSTVEQPVPCSCASEISFGSLPSRFFNVKEPGLFF